MTSTRLQNYTKYGGCWTWIINTQSCGCCVVAFLVVVWCFCAHKCTSVIIFWQVVCPNVLNCEVMAIKMYILYSLHTYMFYPIVGNYMLRMSTHDVIPRIKISASLIVINKRSTLNPQHLWLCWRGGCVEGGGRGWTM